MRILRTLSLLSFLLLLPLVSRPQSTTSADAAAIRGVLDAQTEAWNRGDIDGFMRGYKDAPDTTFIGDKIQHGYQQILARYQAHYTSKANMGSLQFSDLDIRQLDASYAVVTGHFHLEFSAPAQPASGIFSLLWQKTAEGWKIILDHTSLDRNP